ncbi:acyl-CoA synthetase [Pseudorhizobium flavum]|uniref:Acyl-CoA synthetase (AMP-forming)/AMP-acid ligase II n=1 Tax=Pseudorhizobium flavum TaxID=1335061 RepID=A0A7W9YZ76_9HYPH|nr:acyl-CoA synthetase [Pseudorhizobium flavum]MBB6181050.1 acyl-CoA synthetase (AMP-forming)/AMP-acid ligase II [Pseudorhizobium flavum]CAD6601561.1 acyl-CoA synthetase [Pseudorhizobium flavum]
MSQPVPLGGLSPCSNRVMNLASLLTQAARRHPDDTGFVWGEKTWTFAAMEARVNAMAVALARDFGVKKGDRVLVQSSNCNQMFESMFACFRLGAVWVPTNYRQSPEEVAYLAQASGAYGMICGAAFAGHAEACRQTAPSVAFVISIGPSDFGEDYDALVERHAGTTFAHTPVDRDDPCWFFFTSGTTGRPKAAVLTHGQMAFVITNHLCDLMPGTGVGDASIVVAPLSHGAGIHQLTQVAHGVKTVLPASEKFDVAAVWQLIERWKITNVFTVPTILKMLVEDPSVDRYDHSSLRYVIYAGAPMYRADQKRALAKLGAVLVQYFGLGEVTGAITVLPPSRHFLEDGPEARIGTCGFERTGMQVQIQDADGVEVDVGQTGEICVIGPAVFAGYYNNPDANEKAFRNGWFRTGDLGHMDGEGFIYITGRSSDMYISGGSNIYPREIEEKILLHPDVREVAVLGVPDPVWGEVGLAVCVLREGADAAGFDLRSWLEGKMARYKLPKTFVFWDALPKSAYGKITKRLIREELQRRGQMPTFEQAPTA